MAQPRLTVAIPKDTVEITFMCIHCGAGNFHMGVKRSPFPQVGLKCPACRVLNPNGVYLQYEEYNYVYMSTMEDKMLDKDKQLDKEEKPEEGAKDNKGEKGDK